MENQKDTPAVLTALKNHYEGKLKRAYQEAKLCNTALSDLYDRSTKAGFGLTKVYIEEQQ